MDLCTKYLKVGMDLTNGPVILYQDDKEVGLVHQGEIAASFTEEVEGRVDVDQDGSIDDDETVVELG